MQLYRFSPILTSRQFDEAIAYVAGSVRELSGTVIGERFPLESLTVFAHYDDEYERLVDLLRAKGEQVGENNGPFVKLAAPIADVALIRVRKPDPYRMQVGCADLRVPDYEEFKRRYIGAPGVRLIERPEYEMLEVHHPDYDVLAYIVSAPVV
jgi:hypothetical protein